MNNHTTLPEGMISAVKDLLRAFDGYCRQIEEMIVVREALRTQIDKLVSKSAQPGVIRSLDAVDPNLDVPLLLPDAIKPLPRTGLLPQTHRLVPVEPEPHDRLGELIKDDPFKETK